MEINQLFKANKIKNNKEFFYEFFLLIGFIIIGTIGRTLLVGGNLQPFPNFEIIMVLTFIAAILIRPTLAILVPIFSMILSDLLIGNPIFIGSQMNKIVLFTYSGFALIALINIFNRDRFRNIFTSINLKNISFSAGFGIGFVLLFDIWTNFGWWYLIYPHNAYSLVAVFTAGIPFMIYHMISGILTFTVIALPLLSYLSKEKKIDLSFQIKTIHKIPVVAIAICLIALSFTGSAMEVPEKSEVWLEKSDETSIKIVIIGDEWKLEDNVIIYDEVTVYSLLEQISDENGFSIESTYYEAFDSLLIDSINKDVNGENEKYWQYYVNDEIPMIGCDKYIVSNGDYIEWRFEIIPY